MYVASILVKSQTWILLETKSFGKHYKKTTLFLLSAGWVLSKLRAERSKYIPKIVREADQKIMAQKSILDNMDEIKVISLND